MITVVHAVVTLTGAAQQLSVQGIDAIRALHLTPGTGNGNPVFVGGDSSVSATVWGNRLPAAVTGEPPAPLIADGFDDGTVKLSDWWVFGTNGEKLHLLVMGYV